MSDTAGIASLGSLSGNDQIAEATPTTLRTLSNLSVFAYEDRGLEPKVEFRHRMANPKFRKGMVERVRGGQ